MVKKLSFSLTLLIITMISNNVIGGGIPVYSYSEMVTMKVDEMKSDVGAKMVQTQRNLVDSAMNAVGGPETFSAASLKKGLEQVLAQPSELVTGHYEGLQNLLGSASEYGEIEIKKCGGNADEVMKRLNETIAYPAKQADLLKTTTADLNKKAADRVISLQQAATTGLAKAWVAQSDTSDVAKTISKTQEELDNADSQMDVIGTILRLQEETQKSLNSRFSLMADDAITSGLLVLEGNK